MAKLQETLEQEFGRKTIARTELPEYFETGMNPVKHIRPYQEECAKYFLTYMDPANDFDGKQERPLHQTTCSLHPSQSMAQR